jgi:hypothetical protein
MLELRVNNDFYTGKIPEYGFPNPAAETRLALNTNKSFLNAGGYGFWCNKECAARKDAKREGSLAAQASKNEFQSGLLAYLQSDTKSGKIPTGMYVIAGLGILAILGVSYFAFIRNKK